MIDSPWTPEKIAHLTRHWKKDKSAREIAEDIGLPRNAVIGKAQRLGLSGKPYPTKRADRLKTRKAKRAAMDTARVRLLDQARTPVTAANGNAAPAPKPRGARREPFTVTLLELSEDDCRFPQGDRPAALRFCGAPCPPGSSYCDTHHAECWQPPEQRKTSPERPRPKPGRLAMFTPT